MMALLPVLIWPDPALSQTCAAVKAGDDLRALAADMLETMYAAPGRGLAAPQVGVLKRFFVMDIAWRDGTPQPGVYVNPEIVETSFEVASGPESCLSIPGVVTQVKRAVSVRLRWRDLDGATWENDLTGMTAICAQHEIDHLDGIMTLHRAVV